MNTKRTDEEIVAEFAEELVDGRVFRRAAFAGQVNSTMHTYRPPLQTRKYVHFIQTIGKFAGVGQVFAHFVSELGLPVNLYGDEMQMEASVWSKVAEAFERGYEDVIGRTGPEAGRSKDYKRRYTVREALVIMEWIGEALGSTGTGWCVAALLEMEEIPAHMLPRK